MTSADLARHHALAWLNDRLRWERLLTDLHRRADGPDDGFDELLDEADLPAKAA